MVYNKIQERGLNEHSLFRKAEKASRSLNQVIHPEMRRFGIQTRNTLMAQKSEAVAKLLARDLNRKPEVAVIIGGAHAGIEGELKEAEEKRVRELRRDLGKSFDNNRFIVRIDFVTSNGKKLSDLTTQELLGEINPRDLENDMYLWNLVFQRISKFIRTSIYEDPAFNRVG